MKFLKIQNKGELDIRLLYLMGGSTKSDNPNKLGQFGTGLKYAISYLMRTENNFRLFIGEEEYVFSTKEEVISDKSLNEIYCNERSMNITTHYGYQWQAWEALREIWCNAKDEGGESKKETTENSVIKGTAGKTTFFIEMKEDIKEVFDSWENYFLKAVPLFENSRYAIFKNECPDNILRVYKNRVLIHTDKNIKSFFTYDFKEANLNELRQYMGYARNDIGQAILNSSKEVIDLFIPLFKSAKGYAEEKIDFSSSWLWNYSKEKVKEIFEGYLFLSPDSDNSGKSKQSVKVNKSLFDLLVECGLPSERVSRLRGRYYGGSDYGYSESEDARYKEVSNSRLEEKISKILAKYDKNLSYTIAVPIESDFEIMFDDDDGVLLNADVVNYSDSDLESTILIALFTQQDGNMFKALKRLIKFAKSSSSFEKILFGS